MYGTPSPPSLTVPQYASQLRRSMESAYERVRDTMGHSLSRQKDLYDQKVHGKPFEPGDLVWLHCPAVPRGHSKNLHRPWTGPFRVVSKLSDVTYRIQHTRVRRRVVVHFDRLKRCPHSMRLADDAPTAPHRASRRFPDIRRPGSELELIDDPEDITATQPQPVPRYPSRQRRPPDFFGERVFY